MKIIFPIAGKGIRFASAGYQVPKPLIPIEGTPLLVRCIRSLGLSKDDEIVVVYHRRLERFRFSDRLRKELPELSIQFVQLVSDTVGAAECSATIRSSH